MKTYRTNDGELITAEDARDLVRKLRALSHGQEPNIQTFMETVAARVAQQNGAQVATDTPTNFLAGLVQSGLLTEEENR